MQIGDRIIEGMVLEKKKGKRRYEDAVASGHTALEFGESEISKDSLVMHVGNLLPGQEAVVQLRFLNVLKYEPDSYCLRIPSSLIPT